MVDLPLNEYRGSELFATLGVVEPSRVAVASSDSSVHPTSTVIYIPKFTFETNVQRNYLIQLRLQPEKSLAPTAVNIEILGLTSSSNVGPGETLTYTLELKNSDAVAVNDIRVVSNLPPGFKVTNLTPGDKFTSSDGDSSDETVIFSDGTLEVGELAFLKITGIVPQSAIGILEHIVTVEKSINSPITITTNVDSALGPDLRIFYVGDYEDVKPGDSLAFLFLVRNDGSRTVTDVSFNCTISNPGVYRVLEAVVTGDFILTLEGSVIRCTGGALAPGQAENLEIQGIVSEVTSQEEITLIAEIDPGNIITERSETNNTVRFSRAVVPEVRTGNVFVYRSLSDGGDTISDFRAGDKIDITGVLREIGYTGVDPIADGYIVIVPSPPGWLLQIDVDGRNTRGRARSFLFLAVDYQITLEDLIF